MNCFRRLFKNIYTKNRQTVSIQPGIRFEKKPLKIKRALLSVFDKTGIVDLAKELHSRGVDIISTGGTATTLQNAGIPVTEVSSLTGFPEMLDGRVKTLHPAIHGALLARPNYKPDSESLEKNNINPIQLAVVNLYPFEEVIKSDVSHEMAMENIDIGGPAMIRSAAKNVDHICVLSEPQQYSSFFEELNSDGEVSFDFRFAQSQLAFSKTSAYDVAIQTYLYDQAGTGFPERLTLQFKKQSPLRYGENPHQAAAVYGKQQHVISCIHGKQLSYNNYLDVDAALGLMYDFRLGKPAVAIIKHTIPCGVAVSKNLTDAWKLAYATDTNSPFGGVVAVNEPLDLKTAKEIDKIFTEIIVAPSFDEDALELLKSKSNRRLVQVLDIEKYPSKIMMRSVFGGILCQQPDNISIDTKNFRVVTKNKPTESQMQDLLFAWKVVKRVNSNAIVYAKNLHTIGIGSGQPSRVDASELAVNKAQKYGLSLEESVVASDAFFPFADGVEAAARAGAKAVIQPGGSIRDNEVIEAADKHDMVMIFTGLRHFKH